MAYSDDIDALSPDYRWSFDGDHLADTGATNMSNSGMATNGPPLCEGVTASVFCNGTNDNCTGPDNASTADAVNDLCYAGWFMVSDYQRPPFRIFGDGNATTCFQIVAGFGNSVQFDLVSPSDTINVVANQPLVPNREYHLAIVYDDTNKLYGYVDGVAQTITENDTGSAMTARTGGVRCGGSTGTGDFRIGGSSGFRVVSGVNAYYNEWATWQGTIPTATEIREVMFEKGALADVTITNQAGLDALADTLRPDVPCCIRVTGNGVINLTADNVTFDPLASIHVQYTGTGTLNWTNSNGSNASIGSTPNGGTLNFINPATLTINGLINGAEFRIYDNEIANIGNNDTELAGVESNSGTTFVFAHSGAVNTIVLQMMADGYEEVRQNFTLGAQNQTLTLNPIVETNA